MPITSDDLPKGFSMALAQNMDAEHWFHQLSDAEKQKIIDKAKNVQSQEEAQGFVDSLTQG